MIDDDDMESFARRSREERKIASDLPEGEGRDAHTRLADQYDAAADGYRQIKEERQQR